MIKNGIKRLNITLRLPLDFFQSWETPAAQSWSQICSASLFQSLSTLHVWFDHTATDTWAIVDEHTLLDPLLSRLSHTTKVVIILPKLHPLHEHEDRHFLVPRINETTYLYRKLRQRYRCNDHSLHIIHVADFPYFFDLNQTCTLAEVEAFEREGWHEGRDMEALADSEREPMDGWGNI